ncbi:MAG: hypothetical protein AABW86_00880 [Candidatus Micrarchaeota archaeon]
MRYGKYIIMALVLVGLLGVGFAAIDAGANIKSALGCMYVTVKNALAIGMMLLVVAAAVVYAVGQVLGAETRARASVWATAMFIGAIIGALLYILLPFILKQLFSQDTALTDIIDNPDAVGTSCS